jgi:hypothetical protein
VGSAERSARLFLSVHRTRTLHLRTSRRTSRQLIFAARYNRSILTGLTGTFVWWTLETTWKMHRHLHEPAAFRRYLPPAYSVEWVIRGGPAGPPVRDL